MEEDYVKQIKEALEKLNIEINFASKSLSDQTTELNTDLNGSIINLKKLISDFNNESKNTLYELKTFSLLPEKITNSINDIVPKIALEVEKIHESRITEVVTNIADLRKQLLDDIDQYHNRTKNITDQFLRDTESLSNKKGIKFLKTMAIVCTFSSVVSAVTSYIVVTKFPRYISIEGANNVSVENSNVGVYGAKEIKTFGKGK